MIKEFNTASRLMTPLGCRGAQEGSRQGLWRILAGTGKGSKIYKFIHQKGSLFMSSMCGFAARARAEDGCEVGDGDEKEDGDGGSDSGSLAVRSEMHRIKRHKNHDEKRNSTTVPPYWLLPRHRL